nr:MAG TPA: hypothetical protein [Caudoviricetes sp.]
MLSPSSDFQVYGGAGIGNDPAHLLSVGHPHLISGGL